jgi:hypothetical protein
MTVVVFVDVANPRGQSSRPTQLSVKKLALFQDVVKTLTISPVLLLADLLDTLHRGTRSTD